MSRLTVVKVGGSLFDLPDLGHRLQHWLAALTASGILLVPGGGPTADVVHAFDGLHGLGDEKTHWLALRAMTLNAHVLAKLLPGTKVVKSLEGKSQRVAILDAYSFCRADERRHPDAALPHTRAVTSDSIAARVAVATGARQLVLLKSVTIPSGMNWLAVAREGYVDTTFPDVIPTASELEVRMINFRNASL